MVPLPEKHYKKIEFKVSFRYSQKVQDHMSTFSLKSLPFHFNRPSAFNSTEMT